MPIVIPRNGPIPEFLKDTFSQKQKDKIWCDCVYSMGYRLNS